MTVAAGVYLLGCGEAVFDTANDQTAQNSASGSLAESPHVVGGMPSAICGFPMTAKIPGCTSTLLTPTILVTAKHCKPVAGMTIQFGEKSPYAFSVKATKCVSAPDSDAAYCVLPDDDRLKKVPTVPPLSGCEYTRFLKAGVKIMGVGWGDTMGTGPARTKNQAEVPVIKVADPFISTGDPKTDLCFGDSGGGSYIHLVEGAKDWGWRVVGTVTGTTRIPGGAACGGTSYTSILRHIKLIEQMENIDVTPCTDAAGNLTPGAACTNLLTDIVTGGGAWPDCAPGPTTTMPIDSCSGAGPIVGGDGGTPAPDAGARRDAGMTGSGGRADAGGDAAAGKSDAAAGTGGRGGDDAASGLADSGTGTGGTTTTPGPADSGPPASSDGSAGGKTGTNPRPPGASAPSSGAGCGCFVSGPQTNRTGVASLLWMLPMALVLARRRERRRHRR
ncbi:MAG TPA: trypsin-like serine protease [Polyangia bacterium]|nr:trypsin-like serine protease [Polyangia bacterium]